MRNMSSGVATNIINYFEGRRPTFVVNPEVYKPISENEK